MKTTNLFILTIFSTFIFNSCTKETIVKEVEKPNVTIYGFYEGNLTLDKTVKYLDFGTSNVLNIYKNDGGIKSMISTSFVGYEKQAILDFYGYYSNVYIYSTKADSLFIYQGKNLIFNGKKTLSSLVDNWNIEIKSKENWVTNVPNQGYNGLAWNGSNLVMTNYQEDKLYLLNPTSKDIDDIPSQNALNTVEFDGSSYWFCRNGSDQIFKTSTNDATTTTFTSASLHNWITGIAYASNTQIYCYGSNEKSLFLYNPTSNSLVFEKKFDSEGIRDLAYSNGYIYAVCYPNYILKINPAGFIIEKTYVLTDAQNPLFGIAHVSSNTFWVSDSKNILYKVEL